MKLIPTTINPVTITLYRGIPFDNNYNEHTLLSTRFKYRAYSSGDYENIGNDKEAFINMSDSNNNYIYPRTTKTGTYNFAFGNGLVTSVVLELTGDEINSNYMKVISGSDVYYYFITGIIQKNEVTYLLNLELDVFMTYSEEFLTNMKDKPVLVERKHCRRLLHPNPTTDKINMACFNQESHFNGIKANITKNVTSLKFTNYTTNTNNILSYLSWFYIIVGKGGDYVQMPYKENDTQYPYNVICIPTKKVKLKLTQINEEWYLDANVAMEAIMGHSAVQKIIISPFPPFMLSDNFNFYRSGDDIVWEVTECTKTSATGIADYREFYSGSVQSGTHFKSIGTVTNNQPSPLACCFNITDGFGGQYKYSEISNYFDVTSLQSIDGTRDNQEYKLQIAPFKELKMSSYYGGENTIPTQLLFLQNFKLANKNKIIPYTIASSNAETNSYWDYCFLGNEEVDSKRGVSNVASYNYPTSTNAELIYNQSQKSQYENTRLINGIAGGIQIAGGIASIAIAPSAIGKVAGGIAIAGGVVSEIKNITEYSAKMEDLKHTPDSYNFAGNSFSLDKSVSTCGSGGGSMLPYIIEYGVDNKTYDMCAEFLYHYGYEYNAESYFNDEMNLSSDNIFERSLFNYVKLNEDVATKLVGSNLPLIVAKKMNEVLNNGIKFWTFFAFDLTNSSVVNNVLTKYFQKSTYCNAEVNGEW